jgi:hypothetical protein
MVAPLMNTSVSPFLFVYTTWDGYSDGAYDVDPPSNASGAVENAPAPFTLLPTSPYTFKQALSFNPAGSDPTELPLEWYTTFGSNVWWLYVNGIAIGYYPYSLYTSSLASGANGNGITLYVGGEVYAGHNGTDMAQMGTGMPAEAGYPYAAYQYDMQYAGLEEGESFVSPFTITTTCGGEICTPGAIPLCRVNPKCISPWYDPYPSCYDFSATGGLSNWGSYFFFGGTSYPTDPGFKSGCTGNFH